MAQHLVRGGRWIHVFEEACFGGRGRLLALGEREAAGRIGSIIVGPAAVAEVLDGDDQEVMKLPQLKLIEDFSKYILKKQVSSIRVAKARAQRPIKNC